MWIFCQIIAGEIPVKPFFENDQVFAFLDHEPMNFGHVLVLPRNHYENIEETPVEVLQAIIAAVKEIGLKIKDKLDYPAYNVIVNNGPEAGQKVFHSHWHITPRLDVGEIIWPPQKEYGPGEMEEILEKLLS